MARFQTTKRRPDDGIRRDMTPDDVKFLQALQTELLTQDTMCQADPRFWVIAGREEYETNRDSAERAVIVDTDTGEEVAHDLPSAVAWLGDGIGPELDDECGTGLVVAYEDAAGRACVHSTDGSRVEIHERLDDVDDVVDVLEAIGVHRFKARYFACRSKRYDDTLFLTHKDAEYHLISFGYNYDESAHAFAMTADRSPSYSRLLEILQRVDWSGVLVKEE